VQVIVAVFNDEAGASGALEGLKQAKCEKLTGIQAAAVLRKGNDGKLRIRETADMGGGKGAAFGGAVGAAISLIAGPALVVPAAVGSLIGGLAAKWRDSGFSDAQLKRLGKGLTPGSSAIIAIVEHTWVAEVEKHLAQTGADMVTEALRQDIAEQLEAGYDGAYTALASHEGFAAARVAGNDDEVEGSAIVVGEDEAVGARFVATSEGFVVEAESDDAEQDAG
jgi:uncharacterized membrane protein